MTVFHSEKAYLESPYERDEYLTTQVEASMGIQAHLVIDAQVALATQLRAEILDYLNATGLQAQGNILDQENFLAMQSQLNIEATLSPAALQAFQEIKDRLRALAIQAEQNIGEFPRPFAAQMFQTSLTHLRAGSYLVGDYLEDAYLTAMIHAVLPLEFHGKLEAEIETAVQFQGQIVDKLLPLAIQLRGQIVDKLGPLAFQFLMQKSSFTALQFLMRLYNTTNLRILCDFADMVWTASSTEPGHFDVDNLNSDIVEKIWRSSFGAVTGVTITGDSQIAQGIAVDTLAILNHNLTTSGSITLLGSNDPLFGTIGKTINLSITPENIYYIAPEMPLTTWRYWRMVIDDASNPDTFLSIGTVLMGSAEILQGEEYSDDIEFGYKDFADKVETEGFTNITNARALKKNLSLSFRSLDTGLPNFAMLRRIVTEYRTSHKCLWIPTPDPTDMEVTGRYTVYGKLAEIPKEKHNNVNSELTYVDFGVEVDESL